MSKKIKKKRVLYPWLKYRQSRLYKCMISIIIDKELNWNNIFKENKSIKKIFVKLIYPKLKHFFPDMYIKIAKYYSRKGRSINETDFINLAYLRMTSMFHINKKSKSIILSTEHPKKSKDLIFKKAYGLSLRLYKKNKSFSEYLEEKGKK